MPRFYFHYPISPFAFAYRLTVAGAVLVVALSGAAQASTNSGIDTPTGVTSLPFAIEGNEVMDMTASGLGIGSATPQAALDVNGGAHFGPGSSPAVATDACSSEGTIAYDYTDHEVVYCSNSGKWTAIVAGIPVNRTWHAISCGSGGTNNYSYPMDILVIYNIDSYVTVGGVQFGATGSGLGCRPVSATVPPGQTWATSGGGTTAGCAGCYALY